MNKRYFLSVDGGGTKLRMLLFDEDFRVRGEGFRGGVNLNSTTEPDARLNIRQCLEQVFSSVAPAEIQRLYYVFVGHAVFLLDALREFTAVSETIPMSEPEAALLAGALWGSGFVALAGTGSDVFFVPGDKDAVSIKTPSHDIGLTPWENFAAPRTVVGAWGPIIGDDGGGVWIGQQAIRRAVAGLEGWAEPTLILEYIRRDWRLSTYWDMVGIVHGSPAPFRQVASLTKIVGEAAEAGDTVARNILTEAGVLMARQTICLTKRFNAPVSECRLVTCGGAWKSHPMMFRAFKEELADGCPAMSVRLHSFEHVMAGPARELINRDNGKIVPAEAEKYLSDSFPDYVINWR